MRLSTRGHRSRSILLWLILAYALVQTGCASVEHIRLYREARTDFSNAAKSDNVEVLRNLFPDPKTIGDVPKTQSTLNFFNGAQQSYERWYAVHVEFAALNSRASNELAQDQLLGSSKALEIISKSRQDLYAHILSAGGKPVAPPTAATRGPVQSQDPLTVSVAMANELLSQKDIQLFPRDEYLLRSLRPTVRYEIAYVNALRAAPPDSAAASLDTIAPIVGQMAQAEKELEGASRDSPANVKSHATMSRLTMLVTARFLVQERARKVPPLITRTDEDLTRHSELACLSERIHNFLTQASTPDTSENNVFKSLGAEPTIPNLTDWGLGEIQEPPPDIAGNADACKM